MNTEHLPSGESKCCFPCLVTNAFLAIGCRLFVLSRNAWLRTSGFYRCQSVEIKRLISRSGGRMAAVDQRRSVDQVPSIANWPGSRVYGGIVLHDLTRCR